MLLSRSAAGGPRAWIPHRDDVQMASSAAVHSHLTRTWVACAHALCHLPSAKSRQEEHHLGRQVGQSGLDCLLGPDGIPLDLLLGPRSVARLQGLEAQATIIVADEGDVGVLSGQGRPGAARSTTSIIWEECVMGMSEPWDLCGESVTKV